MPRHGPCSSLSTGSPSPQEKGARTMSRLSAVALAFVAAAAVLTLAGPHSNAVAQNPAPLPPGLLRMDPIGPTPDPEALDPAELVASQSPTSAAQVECDVDNGG